MREHAEIHTVAPRQGMVLLRAIERQSLGVMSPGLGWLSPKAQDHPHVMVGK